MHFHHLFLHASATNPEGYCVNGKGKAPATGFLGAVYRSSNLGQSAKLRLVRRRQGQVHGIIARNWRGNRAFPAGSLPFSAGPARAEQLALNLALFPSLFLRFFSAFSPVDGYRHLTGALP